MVSFFKITAMQMRILFLIWLWCWGGRKLFSQLFSLEMDVVSPRMSCFPEPGVSRGQGKLEGEGCCRGMLLRRNAAVGGMPRLRGCRSMGVLDDGRLCRVKGC